MNRGDKQFIDALNHIGRIAKEIRANNGGWSSKENSLILDRVNSFNWNIDGIEELKTRLLIDDCQYYRDKLQQYKKEQLQYLDLLN